MDAFGAAGAADRLPGGQGQSFAAGDIVLKPAPDEEAASWSADVLSTVVADGFRVALPIRCRSGGWVFDGWCAHSLVSGEHRTGDGPWPEALAACRAFHRALVNVPPPPFLQRRDDRFALADRVVWGEQAVEVAEPIASVLSELAAVTRPVSSPSQVIHGDVAGNLLFAAGLPPAIVDFSPYWRPAGHAIAQTIVDAILWYGAHLDLIAAASDVAELDQFLARALAFRLVLDALQLEEAAPTARFQASQVRSDLHQAAPIVAWLHR
jgi:uncharacterized protein (TIGR02569 family)